MILGVVESSTLPLFEVILNIGLKFGDLQDKTLLFKFESFKKNCLKWILLEEELSYHSQSHI